jgi:hypothetical protein
LWGYFWCNTRTLGMGGFHDSQRPEYGIWLFGRGRRRWSISVIRDCLCELKMTIFSSFLGSGEANGSSNGSN